MGGNLYLNVSLTGNRSWIFRYMFNGRSREMGLGPLALIPLKEAREQAIELRRMLFKGMDPLEEKARIRQKKALDQAKSITFDQCAFSYIESHRAGWKNPKHGAQWESTLNTYASPFFGKIPVQDVDTALVIKALTPIWTQKPETASRVRSRIELVLSWATAREYRTGDNPARWRGHLDMLLPKPTKIRKVAHHPALPIDDMPAFMEALRKENGLGARALEFLILTATRTGEVLGATWQEINLDQGIWTIPRERMKAGREHRVPLSRRAIELLTNLPRISDHCDSDFLYPGLKAGQSLSNMSLLAVLKRMECKVTSHGFRSTFRDWAAERTNYPREVAEAALAHTLKDKVEAAYRRGDLFLKRRRLMQEWERYCHSDVNTPNAKGASRIHEKAI